MPAGQLDDAIAHLRVAVDLQDHVLYDEPPAWYFSRAANRSAGALLAANKPVEAEAVFREDLKAAFQIAVGAAHLELEKSRARSGSNRRSRRSERTVPEGLGPGGHTSAMTIGASAITVGAVPIFALELSSPSPSSRRFLWR